MDRTSLILFWTYKWLFWDANFFVAFLSFFRINWFVRQRSSPSQSASWSLALGIRLCFQNHLWTRTTFPTCEFFPKYIPLRSNPVQNLKPIWRESNYVLDMSGRCSPIEGKGDDEDNNADHFKVGGRNEGHDDHAEGRHQKSKGSVHLSEKGERRPPASA